MCTEPGVVAVVYDDHLLRELGVRVVSNGGKRGPAVPAKFRPGSLQLIRPFREFEGGPSGCPTVGDACSTTYYRGKFVPGRDYLWWYMNNQGCIPKRWKRVENIAFFGDGDLGEEDNCGISYYPPCYLSMSWYKEEQRWTCGRITTSILHWHTEWRAVVKLLKNAF